MLILLTSNRYESQAGNLRNQAFNMEQANFAVQSLKDTQSTVAAMKTGVKQMQKEFKNIKIDDIEVRFFIIAKHLYSTVFLFIV